MNRYEQLASEIHFANIKAGWWTDLSSMASTVPTRDRGRILMLMVSEVSEADHGISKNLSDDKLPHLPMFDVEIADVAIRTADVIGAENSLYGPLEFDYDVAVSEAVEELRGNGIRRDWFRHLVNKISQALEYERKTRTLEYRTELASILASCFAIAETFDFDLWDVIKQKREFNAAREDHKIENRIKDGGKKT